MFLESAQKKETFATVFTKYFFLLMNSVDVNFELAFARIALLTLNVICLVFLVGMVNKLDFGVETLCAHVAKVFHFV